MKVLLIQPKYNTQLVTPPLGLGYLASALREAGHEAVIEDCILTKATPSEALSKHNPDLVCVSAMTVFYSSALDYIKEAKKKGLTTIIGGNHVTALPLDTIKNPYIDFGVIGEGEKTLIELINSIEKRKEVKNVKGICYNNNLTQPREFIKSLDDISPPAWDLINPKKYPPAYHGSVSKRHPVAPIISSRGCPFNCYFCSSIGTWKRSIRFRSPEKLVDEIEMLVTDFGVREFHFEDDNLTMNRSHAMGVCDEIIKRKLDITWACPNGVRIDKLDRELLSKMKKSGCHMLSFGIESGSQKILDKMNKNLDLRIVPDMVRLVKEIGIDANGFFIIGLPGDTEETIRQTIEFSKRVPFDRALFGTFVPLPGSMAFEEWAKDKKISELNWGNFDMFHFISTGGLSEEELVRLQKNAFREFYFRPRTILKILSDIKIRQLKIIAKRAMSYYMR